jgi:hypothetical protein
VPKNCRIIGQIVIADKSQYLPLQALIAKSVELDYWDTLIKANNLTNIVD